MESEEDSAFTEPRNRLRLSELNIAMIYSSMVGADKCLNATIKHSGLIWSHTGQLLRRGSQDKKEL